jgi:hypothetical protein
VCFINSSFFPFFDLVAAEDGSGMNHAAFQMAFQALATSPTVITMPPFGFSSHRLEASRG